MQPNHAYATGSAMPRKFTLIVLFALLSFSARAASDFDLIAIPAGTAMLGDPGGDANEIVKTVEIAAFRLMRREVTNRQFARFVQDNGYRTTVEKLQEGHLWNRRWRRVASANWRHPQGADGTFDGLDDHPVVQVSALDAAAFCRHYSMRLPSEDEWEYAARGPRGFRYPWGNTLTRETLRSLTNAGTYNCCAPSKADGYARTAPVGSYPRGRSPFGLDDLAGNVWEWTATQFPGRPNERVIRGGGWGNNPYCLRAAYRHGNAPEIGLDMVGFRCAAD
jgi:iron(II)-dependent oxidoreductase